ncbi:putative tagatose-6-phosphate ketose/aldose isomerase [Octadecabacter antarcticus 307]|uniref:Putative tagatose-6-phosphate ketose/aldose isomerase n=1 Tax=Octadecabacter antarcticus 307 TaxID=391626 RepID=M9RH20_9RHOB|nr:SIS domain-containing protein [Octadecabacter antarcticus]AGI69706.1 putative tagatose-6-phosphate ketose/aldose isomerase [Octadecabacter antarcticus 307]
MRNSASLDRWDTWREIHSQPTIWSAWGRDFDPAPLRDWIDEQHVDEVLFCGAGTSAFIGDIIVAGLEGQVGPRLRSVPSTDLVARPQAFLRGKRPLLVSFGRSGNSTESIGTLDALDALAPTAPRLHITCNGDGALAQRPSMGPSKVIVLPPETHDAGFAMTSSFSTMLLTALALFDSPCDFSARMDGMATELTRLLPIFGAATNDVAARSVYLGTGPLARAARESALKVLELTAGQTPTLSDSTLGFRHGPKSFVTDGTNITVFLSPQSPADAYETDLVAELRNQFPSAAVTTIGAGGDIEIVMPAGPTWAAPLCVAASQVSGVIWSDALGLNVDNPFAGQGTLSRVVDGVKLYPVAT